MSHDDAIFDHRKRRTATEENVHVILRHEGTKSALNDGIDLVTTVEHVCARQGVEVGSMTAHIPGTKMRSSSQHENANFVEKVQG